MNDIMVKNIGNGPLAINAMWAPGVERLVPRSTWKKGDQGLVRGFRMDKRVVPQAITLMPGQEARLPGTAASVDQVAGLARAGLLKVWPAPMTKEAPEAHKDVEITEAPKDNDEGADEAKPRSRRSR
jgi:hypothetical protein